MDELEPCPFCGSEPKLREGPASCVVWCSTCKSVGPRISRHLDGYYEPRAAEIAVEKWNSPERKVASVNQETPMYLGAFTIVIEITHYTKEVRKITSKFFDRLLDLHGDIIRECSGPHINGLCTFQFEVQDGIPLAEQIQSARDYVLKALLDEIDSQKEKKHADLQSRNV